MTQSKFVHMSGITFIWYANNKKNGTQNNVKVLKGGEGGQTKGINNIGKI